MVFNFQELIVENNDDILKYAFRIYLHAIFILQMFLSVFLNFLKNNWKTWNFFKNSKEPKLTTIEAYPLKNHFILECWVVASVSIPPRG